MQNLFFSAELLVQFIFRLFLFMLSEDNENYYYTQKEKIFIRILTAITIENNECFIILN